MYGLLLQVDPALCTFVVSIRLRVVITANWISEKSIVNTCKMFTLKVDFLSTSLPRIPSQMVLFLYFGLAMSSTMSGSGRLRPPDPKMMAGVSQPCTCVQGFKREPAQSRLVTDSSSSPTAKTPRSSIVPHVAVGTPVSKKS